MNPNLYLAGVLKKHSVANNILRLAAINKTQSDITSLINRWAGSYINYVQLSGSNAKGTAIVGSADLDLFISLKTGLPHSFTDVRKSLGDFLKVYGYLPRFQNSSIGITHTVNGQKIEVDLVPGKLQPGSLFLQDHSIYVKKTGSWTKTNINNQINTIKNSRKIDEIKLVKIWRNQHNLEFPSFCVELAVINSPSPALGLLHPLPDRLVAVLKYLRDDFESANLFDPGNKSNNVSDELSFSEKRTIASQAANSLNGSWNQVVW